MMRSRKGFSHEPTAGDELIESAGLSRPEYEQIGEETAAKVGGGGAKMRRRAFDLGLPPLPGLHRGGGEGR